MTTVDRISDVDLNEFLTSSNVKKGWRRLIEDYAREELREALRSFRSFDIAQRVPEENKILKAFSMAEPEQIKVVIIGSSPAISGACGLAFTTEDHVPNIPDGAIRRFCDAIREAGIHERPPTNFLKRCAPNGILLLNAALTMHGTENKDLIRQHNEIWEPFMKKLLKSWLERTEFPKPHKLDVLCLGYEWEADDGITYRFYAMELWDVVSVDNTNLDINVHCCHHPTFPANNNNFRINCPDILNEIIVRQSVFTMPV